MKRRAGNVILFLLLGAILNTAVAWGCVSLCHLDSTAAWVTKHDIAYWRAHPTAKKFGDLTPMARSVSSFGVFQHISTAVWTDYDQAMVVGSCGHVAAGWPWLAFHGDADDVNRPDWLRKGVLRSPWRPSFRLKHDGWRDLPFIPIWPGFAINTIFYAAILWLIFGFPFAVRRRRRVKRGLCTACGYDLRQIPHNVCPECGVTVSKTS